MLKSLSKKREGVYRSVSLSLTPGEFSKEKIPLEIFLVTWNNPYVFAKGNLFFINQIYFYEEFPVPVDAMKSVYFEFWISSATVSLLGHYGPNEWTTRYVKNGMHDHAQKAVVHNLYRDWL